jgi:NADH:ubiquinone oxidoreductase subunit H
MFFLWYDDSIFLSFLRPEILSIFSSNYTTPYENILINNGLVFYLTVCILYKTAYLYLKSLVYSLNSILFFKIIITNSVVFAVKFLVLIALMIFIRGGIPRYRYDFLTKIG